MFTVPPSFNWSNHGLTFEASRVTTARLILLPAVNGMPGNTSENITLLPSIFRRECITRDLAASGSG
ncbi:hypothetical protein D3C81_2244860 [compost metagenome]